MPERGEDGLKDKNRNISQLPSPASKFLMFGGYPNVVLGAFSNQPGLLTVTVPSVCYRYAVCLKAEVRLNK